MNIEQVSYTKFRMHLANFINQVTKSNFPLRLLRKNHEPVYIISKDMYEHVIKEMPSKAQNKLFNSGAIKKEQRRE